MEEVVKFWREFLGDVVRSSKLGVQKSCVLNQRLLTSQLRRIEFEDIFLIT